MVKLIIYGVVESSSCCSNFVVYVDIFLDKDCFSLQIMTDYDFVLNRYNSSKSYLRQLCMLTLAHNAHTHTYACLSIYGSS